MEQEFIRLFVLWTAIGLHLGAIAAMLALGWALIKAEINEWTKG